MIVRLPPPVQTPLVQPILLAPARPTAALALFTSPATLPPPPPPRRPATSAGSPPALLPRAYLPAEAIAAEVEAACQSGLYAAAAAAQAREEANGSGRDESEGADREDTTAPARRASEDDGTRADMVAAEAGAGSPAATDRSASGEKSWRIMTCCPVERLLSSHF